MRLLVVGKHGQLARALADAVIPPDIELAFAARPALDLSQPGSAAAAIARMRPDVIINAAAYTAVDQAEREPALAFAINDQGVGEIATAATAAGARLIHISTDYVFDGHTREPLDEQSPTAPLNVYGRSKLAGEAAVRRHAPDALIVRTSWVYSSFGSNFVRTILRLAAECDTLRIVDDQIGSPTSASDLAAALIAIAARLRQAYPGGTYHFAGSEPCSWAGFAAGIVAASAALGGPSAAIEPIATADYPTPAIRPAFTVLDCGKFDRDFGSARPGWPSAIGAVVARLSADR